MTLNYFTDQDGLDGLNPVRTETARTIKDVRRVERKLPMGRTRRDRNAYVRYIAKAGLEARGIKWEPK